MTVHNNPLENPYMSKVNKHLNGATEPDELEVLKSLYEYDEATGLTGKPLFEDNGSDDD